MEPPSPRAPCLTLDDGKVSARVEDWETFSYWRRTFRVRHCSSLRSGLVDWEQINCSSIPGDRAFQGDQSNNSCQVWASLGLSPHSSSLGAHILTVVYSYSLWTQISRCEGNSASCADYLLPLPKAISCPCCRQNIPDPVLCALNGPEEKLWSQWNWLTKIQAASFCRLCSSTDSLLYKP